MKRISILGSTGSIGKQALEVIAASGCNLQVQCLAAHSNWQELAVQARKHRPALVAIYESKHHADLKEALADLETEVLAGEEGLLACATHTLTNVVLTAVVGAIGLLPTLAAIKAGKTIALANKETLVIAGDLVMQAARENSVSILPVDSEHSAIFQCLVGEDPQSVEKLILTASGGPFRGFTKAALSNITPAMALKHPNWSMGAKITIDSATLMNKGLEVIEAKHLFAIDARDIEVVVHPQSIIHSLVQFKDSSVKAQLGIPDMKLPIHYALHYPARRAADYKPLDLVAVGKFDFEQPDVKVFRNLKLAYEALAKGGNMCAAMNAANEVVVAAFLGLKISFTGMSEVIEWVMGEVEFIEKPTLADYLETDRLARTMAAKKIM